MVPRPRWISNLRALVPFYIDKKKQRGDGQANEKSKGVLWFFSWPWGNRAERVWKTGRTEEKTCLSRLIYLTYSQTSNTRET